MPVLKILVSVPAALFVLAALGLVLAQRRPRLGRWTTALAAILLFLFSLPLVAALLMSGLQPYAPLDPSEVPRDVGAIVVLAADFRPDAPEYPSESVGPLTLERLRYAAFLARETRLPLLVSGGRSRPDRGSIAAAMRGVLEQEYGIEVRWTEERSTTTRENARESAAILRAAGIERAALVTHAWHQPRALAAFRRAGLECVPAPTAFVTWPRPGLRAVLPSARALHDSAWATHEWIGRLWYALLG